ncbi:MAG: hypothetical protein COB30_018130 [Ectothiorhodospiraceae bacterium]|nr:hypothetical protein [Ectothiorhodospiraceae bacterium]
MQTLISHPAFQSALAPFVVAVLMVLAVTRFRPDLSSQWLGLAILGGFLSTVLLTTGLSIWPVTSTQKLIFSALTLPVFVILMEWLYRLLAARVLPGESVKGQFFITIFLPVALLVAAQCWIIWPVLMRQEWADAWPMVLRVTGYVAAIGTIFLGLGRLREPEKKLAQGVSILVLGLGTGITCLLVATALYAQLAFAISASVGGLLLMTLFPWCRIALGHVASFGLFAAAVPLALLGASATVYAQPHLPFWALPCLMAIPLLAWWPTIRVSDPWLKVVVTPLLAFIPVIPAIWLAWRAGGPVSF